MKHNICNRTKVILCFMQIYKWNNLSIRKIILFFLFVLNIGLFFLALSGGKRGINWFAVDWFNIFFIQCKLFKKFFQTWSDQPLSSLNIFNAKENKYILITSVSGTSQIALWSVKIIISLNSKEDKTFI